MKTILLLLLPFTILSQTITLNRGPYLQQATPGSVIIRWQTAQSCDSKVMYGTSLGSLNQVATYTTSSTEHEVKITGLLPYTKYYYSILSSGIILSPSSVNQYFMTMPAYGKRGDYRFWVIGDAGTGNNDQRNVRDAFLNYNGNRNIDGWIWLGDNAYNSGFNSEYQSNVFTNNTYENVLKNTVVWPAPGNHDYNNHIPFSPSPVYYDIFTLPTNAECGGVASGTEKYYSYNYGNIHFVVLDSYDESRASNSAMLTWLQSDLQSNTQEWTIAYWHHPPYTKGSHNSDNSNFLDGELVEVRENIVPILESNGVDLLLCGHSHVYERSYLLDGHYGYSNQFQPTMKLDNGSGNYPASCAYQKQTQNSKSHKGTVYVVCGCSGKHDASPSSGWPHPAMYKYTTNDLGSMSVDVKENMLVGTFITSTGTIYDSFTIIKNAGGTHSVSVCANETFTLKSTVPGAVNWYPSSLQNDSLILSVAGNSVIYASDLAGCVKDTFQISVITTGSCSPTGLMEVKESSLAVYPSYLKSGQNWIIIKANQNNITQLRLLDILGKEIYNTKIEVIKGENIIELPGELKSGMFFLFIENDNTEQKIKLYVE